MIKCDQCNKEFSNQRGLNSHLKVHKDNYIKPSFTITYTDCKYCTKQIPTSSLVKHEKSCFNNPLNIIYCKQCGTKIKKPNQFCSRSCSASYTNSKRVRVAWSEEAKTRQSILQANSPTKNKGKRCKLFDHTCKICGKHRLVGYKESQRKTCSRECQIVASVSIRPYQNGSRKTTWYYNIHQQKEVLLESSWEVKTAQLLDELGIVWIRPKHIKWIDSNQKERLYFPDFYLPKTDVYLDPKNPYCMEKDKEKLEVVSKNITLVYGHIDHIEQYILSG